MAKEGIPRRYLNARPKGERRLGRAITNWIDNVVNYANKIGTRNRWDKSWDSQE